jgi:hypothetical protein
LPEHVEKLLLNIMDTCTHHSSIPDLALKAIIRVNKQGRKHRFIELSEDDIKDPAGFTINGVCPACLGKGTLVEGDGSLVSKTTTHKRVVATGTTSVTKKNYLANERVTSDGKVYVPTYSSSYTNYGAVEDISEEMVPNYQTVSCYFCHGHKSTFKFYWEGGYFLLN